MVVPAIGQRCMKFTEDNKCVHGTISRVIDNLKSFSVRFDNGDTENYYDFNTPELKILEDDYDDVEEIWHKANQSPIERTNSNEEQSSPPKNGLSKSESSNTSSDRNYESVRASIPIGPMNGDCVVCGLKTPYRCKDCFKAFYCSRRCQRRNWYSHRNLCSILSNFDDKIVQNIGHNTLSSVTDPEVGGSKGSPVYADSMYQIGNEGKQRIHNSSLPTFNDQPPEYPKSENIDHDEFFDDLYAKNNATQPSSSFFTLGDVTMHSDNELNRQRSDSADSTKVVCLESIQPEQWELRALREKSQIDSHSISAIKNEFKFTGSITVFIHNTYGDTSLGPQTNKLTAQELNTLIETSFFWCLELYVAYLDSLDSLRYHSQHPLAVSMDLKKLASGYPPDSIKERKWDSDLVSCSGSFVPVKASNSGNGSSLRQSHFTEKQKSLEAIVEKSIRMSLDFQTGVGNWGDVEDMKLKEDIASQTLNKLRVLIAFASGENRRKDCSHVESSASLSSDSLQVPADQTGNAFTEVSNPDRQEYFYNYQKNDLLNAANSGNILLQLDNDIMASEDKIKQIKDVLGDFVSMSDIKNALIKFYGDVNSATDHLMNSMTDTDAEVYTTDAAVLTADLGTTSNAVKHTHNDDFSQENELTTPLDDVD